MYSNPSAVTHKPRGECSTDCSSVSVDFIT